MKRNSLIIYESPNQPVGYLVNFGHKDALEWKRFILSSS